jgi:hypothetical protein
LLSHSKRFRKIFSHLVLTIAILLVGIPLSISSASADSNSFDFQYTGSVQSFTAPYTGIYQLETWGAQGGNAGYYSYSGATGVGGHGGYSTGDISLTKGQTLYVYVGGQGGSTSGEYVGYSGIRVAGGWNGGGAGLKYGMTGGGGATDIRTSSDGNWQDNLSQRIIVSGGGGGAGNSQNSSVLSNGGAGGGLTGEQMPNNTQFYGRTAGIGGTQSNGYAFGRGADSTFDNLCGGGGSGYYGGRVGDNSTGGGGGSGYIGDVSNGQTIAGNQSMPSPSGSYETGQSGNGYARSH